MATANLRYFMLALLQTRYIPSSGNAKYFSGNTPPPDHPFSKIPGVFSLEEGIQHWMSVRSVGMVPTGDAIFSIDDEWAVKHRMEPGPK